jgi:hypothetical protein
LAVGVAVRAVACILGLMDTLPTPADMTDIELVQEWNCIDCDSEDTARTDALAAELEKRNLDI